jgi:hypothetical protein
MNKRPALAQIIEKIETQKTKSKQVEFLKKYSCKELKTVIGYAMDPGVTWLLPEGDPPFTPLVQSTDQEGRFYNETDKLLYFIASPEGQNVKQIRREQLFIQVLESIDPRDAQLLLRMKNKQLKIKKEAVKEAFPNLAANW